MKRKGKMTEFAVALALAINSDTMIQQPCPVMNTLGRNNTLKVEKLNEEKSGGGLTV